MILRYVPVCECGYVLYGGVSVTVEQYEVDGLFREVHVFYPRACPRCGEPITGVMCNSTYNYPGEKGTCE